MSSSPLHELDSSAAARRDQSRESSALDLTLRALRPLLSDDVYEAFDRAIKGREAKKERVDFTFLSLKSARITGAEMNKRMS